ncbi:MAG TPA: hypothetical protein VMS64_13515 [Candidatus Methylomirabilis sp.]|nr:hypothetical protein [Candidatus Methylomirabilis sp.]
MRERAARRGITLGRTIDERLGAIGAAERKVALPAQRGNGVLPLQ